jgi:HD-like signal output (HDOD) protein
MSMQTEALSAAYPPPVQLVETVVQRMDASGGFPALTRAVSQIVEALEGGVDDITALTSVVLADLSLTQKVLRLANSAMYAPISRNISTVSHALMVLGYEAVGYLALGVRLISSLGQTGMPTPAAEVVLGQSMLAGSIATAVVAKMEMANGEEGVICSLLHRLGQLLVVFYLPEEWRRIQRHMAAGRDEDEAARMVLGISLTELGTLVAQNWNMPAKIVQTMSPEGAQTEAVQDQGLLAVTRFSNQAARIMSAGSGAHVDEQLAALATKYGEALAVDGATLLGAVQIAVDEATEEPFLAGLLRDGDGREQTAEAEAEPGLAHLDEGLQDIRRAIAEGGSPQAIMAMVVEVMFTGQYLQRAAVFMHDPENHCYRVQATLSSKPANHLQGLSFPDAFSPNVVHIALSKHADVYIDNPRDTKIAHRLPDWIAHHGLFPFYILPMTRDGKSLGFLFGLQRDNTDLPDGVLPLLKELRDLLTGVVA